MKKNFCSGLRYSLIQKLNLRVMLALCFMLALSLEVEADVLSDQIVQPQQAISGTVQDSDGIPLAGATVLEKGTRNGSQTNFDGKFQITVTNQNAVLVISYVGFITQEIQVNQQSNITVTLAEDIAALDEVVVVGYGSGRETRKTVAGAVAQISGDVVEERPITNVLNGLQGAIPGVVINRNSGQPGREGYDIQIRGVNSLNGGNAPLVLIDGIEGSLDRLNPNDIKNVTILKDAAAAIYGTRAAGGVLLVTTKKGKKGSAPQTTYTTSYSINRLSNLPSVIGLREWVELEWEAKLAAGALPTFAINGDTLEEALAKVDAGAPAELYGGGGSDYLYYQGAPDWDKILFDDGIIESHNLSVSGGGEHSDYYSSFGFTKTDGILKSSAWDGDERINMRLNYNTDISKRLRLETKLNYERGRTVTQGGPRTRDYVFSVRNRVFQFFPLRTRNGENFLGQWGFDNPANFINKDLSKATDESQSLTTNLKLRYEVFDDLTITGQAGLTQNNSESTNFNDVLPLYNYDNTQTGFASLFNRTRYGIGSGKSTYRNYTAFFNYNKEIGDKHVFDLTGGASHEETESRSIGANVSDLSQLELLGLSFGDQETILANDSGFHWAIKSFFGRLKYVYNSKYILEANFRRDGTSVFAPNQRWGNFGGGFLVWIASEEDFIKNLNVFDNLKFRASIGTVGNQNFDPDNFRAFYDYIPLINIGGAYPFGNDVRGQSATEAGIVSQERTWENIKTTNFGIDFAFFESKLSGSFDYYIKDNKNMLLGVNLPSVLGGRPPSKNIGALETKGFELQLNWTDRISDDFSYNITANLSDNTNVLTDLDGRDQIGSVREGYPLGTVWGWVWDGIIQNQVELNEYLKLDGVPGGVGIGDARYKDVNGDGVLSSIDADGNDADVVNLGTNAARYSFAATIGLNYKNWDFSTFVQGVAKRTIFYTDEFSVPFSQPWWQPLERFRGNTWRPDRPNAKYPRLTTGPTRFYNYRTSENNKVSGAYARFKNITLGYSLPNNVIEKVGISSLRLYFSGEDLFTIDAVDGGYDAENTNGSSAFYPFTKRYSLGLTLTF